MRKYSKYRYNEFMHENSFGLTEDFIFKMEFSKEQRDWFTEKFISMRKLRAAYEEQVKDLMKIRNNLLNLNN